MKSRKIISFVNNKKTVKYYTRAAIHYHLIIHNIKPKLIR
jgi:hypothetical protein